MTVSYTVDEMLARIRRTMQTRPANRKLSDAEIIEIADEQVQSVLWPQLRTTTEAYAVREWRGACEAQSVELPNGGIVRLPPRASGSTVMSVACLDSNGQYTIPRFGLDRLIPVGDGFQGLFPVQTAKRPSGYVIMGDSLRLVPTPSETVYLKVFYERRPSRLVSTSDCALATSWSIPFPATINVAVDTVPSSFTTDIPVDLVRQSPQQTDPIADDATLSGIVGTDLTITLGNTFMTPEEVLSSANVSGGFYVCPAGHTCVFPLPDVWWPVAIALSAAEGLSQMGYSTEAAALREGVGPRTDLAIQHSANRARQQPLTIFQRNSPTRVGRRRSFGWRNGGGT